MIETFLRRDAVERNSGLSRSSLYAKMADGTCPKQFKISGRAAAWLESEIIEWQAKQIARRDLSKAA
jgi:prophage regulatory protein